MAASTRPARNPFPPSRFPKFGQALRDIVWKELIGHVPRRGIHPHAANRNPDCTENVQKTWAVLVKRERDFPERALNAATDLAK
jgi:hypothetical protein